MLNVQNEYVNGNIAPKISTEKVNPNISAHKPGNTENTVVNRDTFEYTVSENLSIYSPELINRMETHQMFYRLLQTHVLQQMICKEEI